MTESLDKIRTENAVSVSRWETRTVVGRRWGGAKFKMDLIINFTKNRGEVELKLQEGKRLIDTLTFNFEANLDSVLILAVDKILKRNRIETLSLKTVKVSGNVDKSSSAYKIAQTFIEAMKTEK